jgi:hypothetical protein
MLTFHTTPLIWFGLSIIVIIILYLTSKWGIKKIFSILEVDEIWYKTLDIVFSVLKVLLVASGTIFIASRIFFHDVSVKSYNTDIDMKVQKYNDNQVEQFKLPDPNQIHELNNKLDTERKSTLEDREREESRKARDEFQKFLDTL